MDPLAFFAADNDVGVAENFHVVRKGGLADLQCVQKLAGAFFAVLEQGQNIQAVFIAVCAAGIIVVGYFFNLLQYGLI